MTQTMALPAIQQWNIAMGNFFFRFRNAIFPAIFLLAVPFMRPQIIGTPALDQLLVACGFFVALAGQAIRATTIGFEYIERGGKNKRVYASHLVDGGVYGVMRNPMYVGNALIALGMTMVAGAPLTYLIVLPFFLAVYQSIICAEEAYLRAHFGDEYDAYCAAVPRFLPKCSRIPQAFDGMRYDWKSLRKELSTMAALALAIILLPLWRTFFLQGWDAAATAAPARFSLALLVLALYGLLIFLKKRRLLFY
ncbi:MAG: isoprenylcysteine carboxylmethyltransferase family protein [Candidatus Omnitrophica bacterium]|nr:isoprenylcysteine carboxylmethyltransferase family protein [Candidatus Omnitrophota bacterium]